MSLPALRTASLGVEAAPTVTKFALTFAPATNHPMSVHSLKKVNP